MKPREVLDRTTTPDGEPLELAIEAGHHVIRVRGAALMSSATYGSEQAMASVAAEVLGERPKCRVLIGGLGMGFTCRAALDTFGADAEVTVAELLPALIDYNIGSLGPLADHPLQDARTRLLEGDVRIALEVGGWDVILMDVDNGPEAFTRRGNAGLYEPEGIALMTRALTAGGVVVVWSATSSPRFEGKLKRAGLRVESRRVYARGNANKGPKHTLFVGQSRDRAGQHPAPSR